MASLGSGRHQVVQVKAWDIGLLASGFGQLREVVNHPISLLLSPFMEWRYNYTPYMDGRKAECVKTF